MRAATRGWAAAIVLASCASPTLQNAPLPAIGPQVSPTHGVARFTIEDAYSRFPIRENVSADYFSIGTVYFRVDIGGSGRTIKRDDRKNCKISGLSIRCVVDVPAPNGETQFTFRALGSRKQLLSLATGDVKIDGTTTIPLTLIGRARDVRLEIARRPIAGHADDIPLLIRTRDEAGDLIVGSTPYVHAIQLSNSDKSGAFTLSSTSAKSPNDEITVHYTGAYADAKIRASAPGIRYTPPIDVVPFLTRAAIYHTQVTGSGVVGPDGAMWFPTEQGYEEITTDGFVTPYNLGEFVAMLAIGPDGNVWLGSDGCDGCGQSGVTRVNPDRSLSVFPLSSSVASMILGPNAKLWVTLVGTPTLVQIAADGSMTPFSNPAFANHAAGDEAVGSDGNVWYLDVSGASSCLCTTFDVVTPAGAVSTFHVPLSPNHCCVQAGGVAQGADGGIWFGSQDEIDHIALPSRTIQRFDVCCPSSPVPITVGPDGAIWAPGYSGLIRITNSQSTLGVSGAANIYSTFLAAGPHDTLWFAASNGVGIVPVLARPPSSRISKY